MALVLATAGCLQPPAPTGSYGYGYRSEPYPAQPVARFADPSPPITYQSAPPPAPYQAAPYQPPPLTSSFAPQPAPLPDVGSSRREQIRYLPAPQPPQSLLGPQRPGWNQGLN